MKLLFKTLLVMCLVLFNTVSAEEYIHLGMWSTHFQDKSDNFREKHNSFGIEIDGYFVYTYQNSVNERSVFAGRIRRDWLCTDSQLCLGYNYGIVTGYYEDVIPVILPVISYTMDNGIGFDITCVTDIVCALQARISTKAIGIPTLEGNEGYFEVAVDHADPDHRSAWGYGRENGMMIVIKYYLNDEWYTKLSMDSTSFNVEPERDYPFDAQPIWWGEEPSTLSGKTMFAIGKEYEYKRYTFNLSASYNTLDFQSNSYNRETDEFVSIPMKAYSGYGVHAGVDYKISKNHSFYIEVGVEDTLVTDLKIIGEYRYRLSSDVELTVRTEDYERWNYSKYQLGVRWSF